MADIREAWAGRVKARSGAAVWRALPLVMSQPAVSVNHLGDALNVSKPTAQTAIDHMVAGEVLALSTTSVAIGRGWRERWSMPWTTSPSGQYVCASPLVERLPDN